MTANPAQGVRIDRSGLLRRTAAGRIAIPLTVGKNGDPIGEGDLVLTIASAADLYAELGRMLAESMSLTPPTDQAAEGSRDV